MANKKRVTVELPLPKVGREITLFHPPGAKPDKMRQMAGTVESVDTEEDCFVIKQADGVTSRWYRSMLDRWEYSQVAVDEADEPLFEPIGTVEVYDGTGFVTRMVREVYPGKMGAEPWAGAGDGFFAGGEYHSMAKKDSAWRNLKLKEGPVEVAGVDVRTEPLPLGETPPETYQKTKAELDAKTDGLLAGVTEQQLAAEVGVQNADETAARQGIAEADARAAEADKLAPSPEASTDAPKDKAPRPSLEVAVERYGNLDRELQPFMTRLESWIVKGGESVEAIQAMLDIATVSFRDAWTGLGEQLRDMQKAGVVVKVTNRSRRDAWMRAGVEVALREDTLKRFGRYYSADVLANLVIRDAGDTDVFLMSGSREIGPVPKSQVVRLKAVAP